MRKIKSATASFARPKGRAALWCMSPKSVQRFWENDMQKTKNPQRVARIRFERRAVGSKRQNPLDEVQRVRNRRRASV
ncbi:hypothetical protein [Mesorhizobium sp.]|uniref:hypothetical protein n=1 Tax=Mesorhizobium sp. TaxID=1871066 RepID=UPI0025F5AFEE|nr:hypothetical protein [Mesorhizobium sp.]